MTARPGAHARWLLGCLPCLVVGAGVALGHGGCSQQAIVLPSRDFDRPTDMTFACLGLAEETDQSLRPFGQPMDQCHPAQVIDNAPRFAAPNSPAFRTYAFVPNAERGDLTVIDLSYCRPGDNTCWPPGASLVDLDSMSVGFAGAPLGELPEVVAASQDGCRVVSANRGSCDLTLVNPAVLLGQHSVLDAKLPTKPDPRPYARTVVPRTESGRLAVAPSEIYFLPQQTANHGGDVDLCDPGGVEGTLAAPVGAPVASKAAPASWRAVVTFPSCDLVALIDLPSGDILDSYQVELTTGMENNASVPAYAFNHMGRNPVCPVTDCGGGGPAPTTDGGASDGTAGAGGGAGAGATGGAAGSAGSAGGNTPGAGGAAGDATAMASRNESALVQAGQPATLRVGPLAMHPEGKRIYFGATNSPLVGALDIVGAADTFSVPAAGATTELHDGARGIMRLRLSVDPYDDSKGHGDPTRAQFGRFVASAHDDQPTDPLEFLYAIAKDGTVRVVHVGRPVPAECDLAIDPGDPKAGAVGADTGVRPACFPYGAADGPRRLLFASGPGLRLGGTPQDIAFANYRTPDRGIETVQENLDEQTLNGAFAFVMTTTGAIHILNIDPELRTLFQRYRDAEGVIRGARLPEMPRPLTHSVRDSNVLTFSTSLGPSAGPPRLDNDPTVPVDGPHLMAFDTDETRLDARIVQVGEDPGNLYHRNTYVYFPNRATVNAQPWSILWEGDLAARGTGDIVTPQGPDDPPSFATSISDNGAGFCGVGVDGDVMTLIGCGTDDECYPGTVCVHSSRVPPSVDGRVIQGMCLRQDDATSLRDRCLPMMETFRRYEVVRNTPSTAIVVPKRVEVPRPVYTNTKGERAACEPDANSVPHSLYGCQPEMSTVHDKFKCLKVNTRPDGTPLVAPDPTASPPVVGDVAYRCLQPCSIDSDCQQGRACVAFPGTVDVSDSGKAVEKVCAEGAPIDKWCGLDQLIRYRISAGNAFVVAGGATGRTERVRTRTGAGGPECVPDFTTSPTLVARIPTNTPVCSPGSLPTTDGSTVVWDSAFLSRQDGASPNPCFVFTQKGMMMSTVLSTPADCQKAGALCTVSVLFQNNELRFVMTDLDKPFSETTQIRFDVHGGTAPQMVLPSVDSAAGLPARLVLGPVPAAQQTQTALDATCLGNTANPCTPGRGSDLPYMYVVDQRQVVNTRAGVGVRGQILRITPRVSETTAPMPGYESFTSGGRYFPVQ